MAELTYRDLAPTGPGTIAGRYLRTFWQPIQRSQNLAREQAKPVRVMGESFTLYRGRSGEPHLVGFLCAHRGTQMSTGWVEDDCIRCRYHGWMYDGTGQCVQQPAEDQEFAAKIRIPSYPVREYLGLVFGWFGEGEPPPLPRYPWFEEEGVLEQDTYVRSCNYFYSLDNRGDEVHVIFTHRGSDFTRAGLVQIPDIEAEETDYGVRVVARFPDGKERVACTLMPTMNLFKSSPKAGSDWRERIAWRVPLDDETHLSFGCDLTHVTGDAAKRYSEGRQEEERRLAALPPAEDVAREILAGRLLLDDPDVMARPDLVNIQDCVTQMGQPQVGLRPPEHLGRSDRAILVFRHIWLREMKALAEGRPLKKWAVPSELATTGGA